MPRDFGAFEFQFQIVDDPIPNNPTVFERGYARSIADAEEQARSRLAAWRPAGANGYRVIDFYTKMPVSFGPGEE